MNVHVATDAFLLLINNGMACTGLARCCFSHHFFLVLVQRIEGLYPPLCSNEVWEFHSLI